jgi:predicted lipoprotein with Yx(FWY)xxD motif
MLPRLGVVAGAALLSFVSVAVAGATVTDTMAPVKTFKDARLGQVLVTPSGHAIYTWNREKDHKVHCTGSCAKAWPPVLIKGNATVPKHVAGIMGTFTVVMRPGGGHQLALDRRPLYTYSGEGAHQVKCNNVDGWFAVKTHELRE